MADKQETEHRQNGPDPVGAKTLVGLGESLFDCFEDAAVLGGAPLNVAVHANALLGRVGGRALPASAIGKDALGDEVLTQLRSKGISTELVQRHVALPTGRVTVEVGPSGDASYVFDPRSAWDEIVFDEPMRSQAAACDAVVFGTLAQRASPSRDAIHSFLQAAPQAVRLFDVNLRQDFYDRDVIHNSLQVANAAKMNEEELVYVAELIGLAGDGSSLHACAEALRPEYNLDWLAVTRSEHGGLVLDPQGWHEGKLAKVVREADADTVGAGDAFCAALLCGRLSNLSTQQSLDLANTVGAYVASTAGATPTLPEELLERFVALVAAAQQDPRC